MLLMAIIIRELEFLKRKRTCIIVIDILVALVVQHLVLKLIIIMGVFLIITINADVVNNK